MIHFIIRRFEVADTSGRRRSPTTGKLDFILFCSPNVGTIIIVSRTGHTHPKSFRNAGGRDEINVRVLVILAATYCIIRIIVVSISLWRDIDGARDFPYNIRRRCRGVHGGGGNELFGCGRLSSRPSSPTINGGLSGEHTHLHTDAHSYAVPLGAPSPLTSPHSTVIAFGRYFASFVLVANGIFAAHITTFDHREQSNDLKTIFLNGW